MADFYVVPNIYSDMSDQSQGYFAFRFHCQICGWSVDSMPIRSNVATATNIMDIGVGLLGGFWGRAAETGEKMYGSKWHAEQAEALKKAWAQVKPDFHYCPKCHLTVCTRCFNLKLNLCVNCAPDLKADAASFQHDLNVQAQRQQIEENYQAPQFNTDAVPSAVTPDMLRPQPGARAMPPQPGQPALPPQQPPQMNQAMTPAAMAGFATPGYPKEAVCPNCRRLGTPGKFCEDCGTKIPLPDLFCPRCAEPVQPTTRFCPECGTRLQQAM
jgi:membrane protease subunit (stomatin/prohibitin family)